jgi:H+-transporting ATPase
MLVLAGQANVYVLRERGPLWSSRPARVMLLASAADVSIVTTLAVGGILMSPLPLPIIGMLFLATLAFALVMDIIKRSVLSRLPID